MIGKITRWVEHNMCSYSPILRLHEIYYHKIVERETKLANLTKKDTILCIGCGAMPCTVLGIANLTGAKIVTIDSDYKAVVEARNIICEKGLENQISVIHETGESVDIGNFTVVHIALQVTPKQTVVEHVLKNAKEGTKVLVRIPKGFLQRFYSSITENIICKGSRFTKQPYSMMKGTMLFIKPKGDIGNEEENYTLDNRSVWTRIPFIPM